LQELEPILDEAKKAKAEVSDDIDRTIEQTCKQIYDQTRSVLTDSIIDAGDSNLGVPYPGFLSAFQYAEDIKEAILSQISASVVDCEEHARKQTVQGVSDIKELGLKHLGDEYTDLSFRSDVMFRRKKDALARQVEVETELLDFFDLSTILQKQEKMAGGGMALTAVTVIGGRMIGGFGWVDGALSAVKVVGANNIRKLILPGIAVGRTYFFHLYILFESS